MMSDTAMINFDYTDCPALAQVVDGFQFHPVTSKLEEKTAIVERVVKNVYTGEVMTIGVRIDGASHIFFHPLLIVGDKMIFRAFTETEIFQAFRI